jgi:hypothetical protein
MYTQKIVRKRKVRTDFMSIKWTFWDRITKRLSNVLYISKNITFINVYGCVTVLEIRGVTVYSKSPLWMSYSTKKLWDILSQSCSDHWMYITV